MESRVRLQHTIILLILIGAALVAPVASATHGLTYSTPPDGQILVECGPAAQQASDCTGLVQNVVFTGAVASTTITIVGNAEIWVSIGPIGPWASQVSISGDTTRPFTFYVRAIADGSTEGEEAITILLDVDPNFGSDHLVSYTVTDQITAPTVPLIEDHALDEFNIQVDSHCNGDPVTFRVLIDLSSVATTILDMDVTVLTSDTLTALFSVDDSQMATIGSKLWSFNRVISPGSYIAHARVDVNALGGFVDSWDAAAFTVGAGTCTDTPYNDTALLELIDTSTSNILTSINDFHLHVDSHLNYVTNTTLPAIHTHIDSHFVQTWENIENFEFNITTILNDLCVEGRTQ